MSSSQLSPDLVVLVGVLDQVSEMITQVVCRQADAGTTHAIVVSLGGPTTGLGRLS